MRKIARRGRVRLLPYVAEEIAQRVANVSASTGVTESAIVEGALRQYLDGTGDKTLLLRRLDRLGQAVTRDHRELELLSQAFAVFMRLWFAHTPSLEEDAKRAARVDAESRYQQFAEHVGKQFSDGRRFVDDLPHGLVANDAEFDAIGLSSTASPDKGEKS
jgi:predicted DNA-binding protein